jgi:hypothetical protein
MLNLIFLEWKRYDVQLCVFITIEVTVQLTIKEFLDYGSHQSTGCSNPYFQHFRWARWHRLIVGGDMLLEGPPWTWSSYMQITEHKERQSFCKKCFILQLQSFWFNLQIVGTVNKCVGYIWCPMITLWLTQLCRPLASHTSQWRIMDDWCRGK